MEDGNRQEMETRRWNDLWTWGMLWLVVFHSMNMVMIVMDHASVVIGLARISSSPYSSSSVYANAPIATMHSPRMK